MSNHSLMPVNENIFTKIKNYLKKLFKQQIIKDCKIENTDNILENQEKIKDSIFVQSIKIEETEEQKLLQLQKLIREKKITENDLSEEEKNKLRKLYNSQIEDLRKSSLCKRIKEKSLCEVYRLFAIKD